MMAYLLDEPGQRMVAFFEDVHRIRGEVAGTLAPGSPAASERSELDELLRGWIDDLNVGGCALRLTVAEEYHRNVGRLLSDTTSVYSIYPLIRSVVDLAARVVWLLEPDLNGPKRVGRILGDRADSLEEQGRLVGVPSHVGDDATAQRKRLTTKAAAAGVHRERPPSRSQSSEVAWRFGNDDSRIGWTTYQVLSAFSHGTLFAITQAVEPVQGPDGQRLQVPGTEGVMWAQIGATASSEATVVLMGLVPYRMALKRWGDWSGHPSSELEERLAEVTRPFHELIMRAPDEDVPPMGPSTRRGSQSRS